ncbi:MAG: deoxyguanosinetriphosphate triphosphohydrolase [Clostridia bacterium]|nr:deoxyguanosinetriphosphate triphosphohydrolase [Clostridia bacterium]
MSSPREEREKIEELIVCEAGVLARRSAGRRNPEPECAIRTCFQRDVDRIIHCKAFRRLKHKTQVFLQPEGDHYRTRLTHTLEVSRIARTIARALKLNEDLTEAISLGHDLGHTPFGHAGERALNEIYFEGFRHYEQSLRVVDRLERDGRGLNLCYETRMGILNHTTGEPKNTMEADVVRLSDRIAYINHDLDDAERAGILQPGEEPCIVRERIGKRNSERINAIVTDVIEHSGGGTLAMSSGMSEAVLEFTDFMYAEVYKNPVAKGEEGKVENILRGIWEHYVNRPDGLPEDYRRIAEEDGLERAVTDYVSGMTDSFAMETYSDIFIPTVWSVK